MSPQKRFTAINSGNSTRSSLRLLRKDPESSKVSHESDDELPQNPLFLDKLSHSPKAKSQPNEADDSSCRDEPAVIRDREWPVGSIKDHRISSGILEYLAKWYDSILLTKDIRQRRDGSKYVTCESRDWDIARDWAAEPDPVTRKPQRWVQWKDSWRAADDLFNAQGAIEDFHESLREEGLSVFPEEPDMPAFIDAGEDEIEQMIRNRKFLPRKGVNYSEALRSLARNHGGKGAKMRTLAEAQPVRALVLRDEFVDSGRQLDHTRDDRITAGLVFDTGYEQQAQCDRCVKGLGPHRRCVVSLDDFNNGACTNCVSSGAARRCNFHNHPNSKTPYRQPVRQHSNISNYPPSPTSGTPPPPSQSTTRSTGPGKASSVGASRGGSCSSPPSSPMLPSSPSPHYYNRGPSPELGTEHTYDQATKRPSEDREDVREGSSVRPQTSTPPGDTTAAKSSDRSPSISFSGICNTSDDDEDTPDVTDCMAEEAIQEPAKATGRKRKRESSHKVVMPPDLDDLPQHSNCAGWNAPCTQFGVGYASKAPDEGSSLKKGFVFNGKVFDANEASKDEVRFIISQCHCAWAEFFEQVWQHWVHDCQQRGRENSHCKESFLASDGPHVWLNGAVKYKCPSRWPSASGKSQQEAIVIED